MKVLEILPKVVGPNGYRYRVDIPRDNLTLLETVKDWATDLNIKCTIVPGVAFFRESRDVTLFLLTWGK